MKQMPKDLGGDVTTVPQALLIDFEENPDNPHLPHVSSAPNLLDFGKILYKFSKILRNFF